MSEFFNRTIFQRGDYVITTGTLATVMFIWLFVRVILLLIKRFLVRFFSTTKGYQIRATEVYLLVKYFLWTAAIVAMLEIVGIHVTLLIAGSAALLVGLGLGLQQIFQDLVSGIFILIEGIIKVNDVIELDGMVGKIIEINLRTSKVLTRDGIMIIVPNHKFIIEKITNWTHNSQSTRFKVEVGVAYGSDVQKVKAILLTCAHEHPRVINHPEAESNNPFVRFVDFGDSALKFELFFWTDSIFQVEFIKSDLRFTIDQKFREQGVTIPFPQRDIHIKN
ncbi:MAG: mechanosensitive ion channel [Cyclobacteriaceae bacterium]|jgi:small-conductance mechanosensitive channel|nr:mechanosensitive ion channel [Cyclobacteriaceae bacterium]MDH4296037.1 mechanosensitive ion channel [Cyclobacteriaceae bacterium]MDH5249805.1 mechanosensitive ion channel [Cyclobacteriaceae bacterium]